MASIYKRGAQWWGKVQRRRNTFRQPLKTTVKSVAEKRLKEWVDRIDAAAWGDQPARTFDESMLHFLDSHVPTLTASSQSRYITSARMLTPHFENLYLHQITRATLSAFERARRDGGAKAPTIRRDLACLSSMFEVCAIDWDFDIPNPVPRFLRARRKRGLRESPPRTRYLTHEEETALLAAAAKYLKPMIIFAIDTGLRLDEQLSLTWDRVNLRRGEIKVTNTKNKIDRVVPILPDRAQKWAQSPQHIRAPHFVFHKSDGSRYMRVTRGLAGAAKRAGIKGLRWHDLRRTCGCRLLQDHDMRMEAVSRWLGHSSIVTTERSYAFIEIEEIKRHVGAGTKTGTGHAD